MLYKCTRVEPRWAMLCMLYLRVHHIQIALKRVMLDKTFWSHGVPKRPICFSVVSKFKSLLVKAAQTGSLKNPCHPYNSTFF